MATKVFDDLATRFMSFSDALEQQFGDISIDFSLPSKTLSKGSKPASAGDAAGDAKFLAAAAEEREAARKRGEEILQQLAPGYFDGGFDALKHELCQLGPDAKQDDIDIVVDRLTAAMEVGGPVWVTMLVQGLCHAYSPLANQAEPAAAAAAGPALQALCCRHCVRL
jgi:hypothetical protein